MLHKVGAEKSTSGSATSAGAHRGTLHSGGKETFFTWFVIYMIEVLELDSN